MTTELEKQFFETFKISKRKICNHHNCKCPLFDASCIKSACPKQKVLQEIPTGYGTKNCSLIVEEYPQITDRQYLELICVSNKELIKRFDVSGSDLESIKSNILSKCIKDYNFYSNTLCETYNRLAENFKHQVQAIFEGER